MSPITLDRSLLSIVVPVFNEEENLPDLERRLRAAAESMDFDDYEFLHVSDRSPDRTEAMIRRIVARDRRFKEIFLSRNFGHQAAVSALKSEPRYQPVTTAPGRPHDATYAEDGLEPSG